MHGRSSPLVFVTVGTDHHPFDRLIDWVDRWAPRRPAVRLLVQYGTAHPPTHAEGTPFVGPDDFASTLDTAAAVVCSGGPGAIMESRAAGVRPIVVPRRAGLGEHVDDHQRRFADFMSRRGLVTLADDEASLDAALDALAADPDAYRIDERSDAPPGVLRIGELIDDLVLGGP